MADFLKAYAVDETKANEGVWETLSSGVEVLVARQKNAEFTSKMAAMSAKRVKQIEAAEAAGDEAEKERLVSEAWAEALAGTVLRDWRGLEIGGREVPFSVEAAERLLQYTDFRNEIVVLANRRSRFAPENLAELAELLGNTLPGNSSTDES